MTRTRVDTTAGARKVLPGADGGGFPISGLVAAGTNHLFVASEMGPYGWMPLDSKTPTIGRKALLVITDIDARGDRVGRLSVERDADLRPVMKRRSHPGGKDMARCGVLQTGAIRFMPDGSLVVAPGVEPGIYRYSADGKLMQTWDTRPLGIVDDCAMPDKELHLLARDFGERIKWYASRVIVDDILPLSSGPALLLRRVRRA